MPPRPATPGRPYPNIGQAILLVVVAAALQAATGATAYAIVAVARDDDQVDLPRIAFNFNRKDYGRLRQLIDVLNSV